MKLPLLESTAQYFRNVRLDAVLLIANQHLLETNYQMFEHFFRLGLKPSNTFLIGKSYSTNKQVLTKFRKRGVHVHEGSVGFNSHIAYDKYFENESKAFLKFIQTGVSPRNFSKIIVLDDGGYLLDNIDRYFRGAQKIVGIEQTSSGYNRLSIKKHKFTIINVARSNAKLIYESPFIAKVVVKVLKRELTKLKLRPKRALVIGAGHVGREVFSLLKEDYEAHLYDVKKHLSDFGNISLEKILPDFDLIVGVTGKPVITKKIFKHLKKGTILASGSSSDREFSAVDLRQSVPPINNPHKNLYVKGVYLLNCGFPINFDGEEHSAQPNKIQLTRALMFGSVCLAASRRYAPKFIEVDPKLQKRLVNQFQHLAN